MPLLLLLQQFGARCRARMEFDRIDHVVFTVHDIVATCDFYARALGLRVLTFDDGRRARQVGQCKINLHQ